MLDQNAKLKIIEKYKQDAKDTGSSEVQIALFTEEIKALTGHLKEHPKDNSSRRGLLKMVSKRKRLVDFLQQTEPERYEAIAKKLKLKTATKVAA
ncbi:MAG: 30S ribosomal protein S15 [Parcubacteria group bacterium GW2011_GWA2_47_8]|nr:MAG: 30S ribosomal protein S15 [Parcubacteria group bacterium GW2011_GWA2_47_8]